MVTMGYEIIGEKTTGGILIVADHASNHVPENIDLAIESENLERHIAWDIGVASVARQMVLGPNMAAILGVYSRLVVDLNRYPEEESVIPRFSDGLEIKGNNIGAIETAQRLKNYYHPYHDALADLIIQCKPALLLSLHSFAPQLKSKPEEQRPWEIGVLYNEDNRAARIAIPFLEQAGLIVGDQLPYSGKDLNATMNRHGENTGTAYLGIEMRQDKVSNAAGQERYASILTAMCHKITEKLCAVI